MKNMKTTICLMVMVLFMAVGQGFGLTQYKDGVMHNISSTINDDVWVDYLAPEKQTTVNVLDGGNIPYPYQIQGHNDSSINISGGHLCQLGALNNSHINISNGSVDYLWSHDNGHLIINGGSMGGIELYENSQATMSGGTINPNAMCLLLHNSQWTIIGSNFVLDGSPVDYGKINSVLNGGWQSEPYRRITGTLANGDFLDMQFKIDRSNAAIVLVPEPCTILLIGLGRLFLSRRKK